MRDQPKDSLAPPPELPRRATAMVSFGIVALAVVGFLTGTRGASGPEAPDEALTLPSRPAEEDAIPAPTHADLARDDVRRTDARQIASFARLLADRRAPTDPVELSEAAHAEAVSRRAQNRAYDGAPPRIPHAIDPRSSADCAACHGTGLRVAGRVAPAMSHPFFANCTQCHVVDAPPMPGGEAGLASAPPFLTRFEGLPSAGAGPRAYVGAPPQIPHPTFLRERCDSCHGPLADGLATSHLARASCTQCHAPSAELDQRNAPPFP